MVVVVIVVVVGVVVVPFLSPGLSTTIGMHMIAVKVTMSKIANSNLQCLGH